MSEKFEFPQPPDFLSGLGLPELPPRGTGLLTGRAGPRRGGNPRTEAERRARHYSSNPGSNPGIKGLPNIYDLFPAAFPNPPLPRFLMK